MSEQIKAGMGGKTSSSERRELTAVLKSESKKKRRRQSRKELMESLGLTQVRGAVSGRIYYE